jgi:hypothetical protein
MFDTATERVYITKQGATQNATLVTPQEAISTQKRKCKVLLRIASEIDFPKVRTLLESVARNSRNSKATYETGLKHFQRFLVGSTTTKASERKRRGFLCSETENLCVLSS